ncbi:hypothetical protein CMT75_18545 [Elizabethkingia anophelis]|nr:hypothetical protein [Elizabethkingia anophelis]
MKAVIYNSVSGMAEEIEVRGVWNKFGEVKEPNNPDYLNNFETKFIITAKREVYASDDTPGYCDGESRVIRFKA